MRWAIANRANGQLIGTGGFWRLIKPHFRAEIGYELAPEWWGQGVMTEALGAMLGFGFTRMGLHSVEAQIHPDNSGSRRVLEKLGFVQEGYFHENFYDPVEAQFTDTAVFGLLRAAWMRRAGVVKGRATTNSSERMCLHPVADQTASTILSGSVSERSTSQPGAAGCRSPSAAARHTGSAPGTARRSCPRRRRSCCSG